MIYTRLICSKLYNLIFIYGQVVYLILLWSSSPVYYVTELYFIPILFECPKSLSLSLYIGLNNVYTYLSILFYF